MKKYFVNDMLDDSGSSADKSVRRRIRHKVKQDLKQDKYEGEPDKKKFGYDTRFMGGHKKFERWLAKQVGRPWNDVYSEISKATKGRHDIRDNLVWCVEKNVKMIDKKPHVFGWRASGKTWYPLTSGKNYKSFYVHPEDGLLKIAPVR